MQRFFPINPLVKKRQLLRALMKVDAQEIAQSLKRHMIHAPWVVTSHRLPGAAYGKARLA